MRGKFVGQLALLLGALGLSGTARAQQIDSSSFSSQAQAESYLRQNPTGPRAKAAFLAIVEFQLARENRGFSRADIAKGVNLRLSGSSAPTNQVVTGPVPDDSEDLY